LELCNAAQAMVAGGAAAIPARGSPDLAREKVGEADRLTCDRFEGSVGAEGPLVMACSSGKRRRLLKTLLRRGERRGWAQRARGT
jgi:hypothetical protein